MAWLLSGALLPPAVLPATAQASPSGSPPCPLQAFSRSHPTVRHPAGSRSLRSVPPLPFPRQPAGAERSLVGGIRRHRLEPQPCGSPQNKAGTSGPPAIWASICKRRDPRNDLHAGGSRENLGRTHKCEKSAASHRLRVFLSAHLHTPSSSETLFLQRRSQVASSKNPGKAGTEAPCPSRYIPNSGASFITEKPPSLGIAHQSMLDTESLPPPSPGLKMPSYSFGSLTPAPFKQPG